MFSGRKRAFLNQAVICLTEALCSAIYSRLYAAYFYDLKRMSKKSTDAELPVVALKDESARQRWELFHRAIAHAKQCNDAALDDADAGSGDAKSSGPLLTVVR